MKMGLIYWPDLRERHLAEEMLNPSAIRKTHNYNHERGMYIDICDSDLNFKHVVFLITLGNIEFQTSANRTRNSCYAPSNALVLRPVFVE